MNINDIMISPEAEEQLPQVEEAKAVTEADVANADKILREYKGQKSHLDDHIIVDNDWWRMRHWDHLNMKDGDPSSERERGEIDPKSAWLFHNVVSKHADFMDAIPTFAVLPREESDVQSAETLSSILPIVFKQAKFEDAYDKACLAKCQHGTGAYHVYWDGQSRNGLGDIGINDIDILNLYWEGGVEDLQESANVFYVTRMNRALAIEAFPMLKDRVGAGGNNVSADYNKDDYENYSDRIEIVDWYYRRAGVLHCCKYCQGVIISATENEPEIYPNGIYRHGKYPFFIDPLYRLKGSPAGFGLIDVSMSDQEQIDRLSRYALNNALGSSRKKTLVSDELGIDIKDITNPKSEIVKFSGHLTDDKFHVIETTANSAEYLNLINSKSAEMKETTGNHDVMSGGVPAGVTAGSAIAALQEQAGKTSRAVIKSTYRVYEDIALTVIELIREFYSQERIFRIIGQDGQQRFVSFSNKQMLGKPVTTRAGILEQVDAYYDVEVSAQKSNPYSSMAQNELALQLYNAGMFDPARADQALIAIEMMDFKDKNRLKTMISKNGTLQQMVQYLSERLAAAEAMLGIGQQSASAPPTAVSGKKKAKMPEGASEGDVSSEPTTVKKAKEISAQTTQPR